MSWFYLLIACLIFALYYTFYKYRQRQALKVERMRTRIASDLHDDIGSTLSSISMLSEMAKNQENSLRKTGLPIWNEEPNKLALN
jgi:signal transduction histidine kinase